MKIEVMRETARQAARIGGQVLMARRDDPDRTVDRKGARDFVTDADRASQEAIVTFLRQRHPDDAIRAEEDLTVAAAPADAGREWVVDPLDGTTNFIHGYPCFSVSVAVLAAGRPVAGAVFDPVREEMFDAGRGQGAFVNGTPIQVSGVEEMADALLVTGFPFREPGGLESFLIDFHALFRRVSDIRRDGSAALDLCAVAAGRLDGFWELGLSLWDIAAGVLLVEEAGGTVTDLDGGAGHLDSGDILAANPAMHRQMLEILRDNPRRRPGGAAR